MLALVFHTTERGALVESAPSRGIALVPAETVSAELLGESGSIAAGTSDARGSNALPAASERPAGLPSLALASATPADGAGIGSDIGLGAHGIDAGGAGGLGGAGNATTEVFGLRGTGSRFVYVFDRSASMEGYGGRPLRAAKSQLIASLASLDVVHQFQIVFYNDQPHVFNPVENRAPMMMFGTASNKEDAEDFVRSVQGMGGTDHMRALRAAFQLGPDVIFFLTDAEGGFTPQELGEIRRLNRSAAIINVIEFGSGSRPRGRSAEELAHQNHGQYTFRQLSTLTE